MSQLESVSGRWTLQIITRTIPKVRERVGTACAVDFIARVESVLADTPAGAMRALVSLEELACTWIPKLGHPRAGTSPRAAAQNAPMCDDLLLLSVEPQGRWQATARLGQRHRDQIHEYRSPEPGEGHCAG